VLVHSLESFGAADGPGVRFVAFLSGCPFRCRYCHNPDTWARPAAENLTPTDILNRALRYRSYWGKDGGITVSGGEPMVQAREVADLFELAHAEGVNTCLDTAAACFNRDDPEVIRLLELTDTVLLDLKLFDAEAHRALTGSDNVRVLDCARYLDEQGIDVWVRRVLVPGLTDSEEDLRRTGEFVRTLSNVRKVEVLPYHAMGVHKWRALGLEYSLTDVVPPDAAQLLRARELLSF